MSPPADNLRSLYGDTLDWFSTYQVTQCVAKAELYLAFVTLGEWLSFVLAVLSMILGRLESNKY